MIVVEPWDLNVPIVTQGGVATGAYQDKSQEQLQLQVRPATQKNVSFEVQKQKEVFLEVRLNFVDAAKLSMSKEIKEIPEWFQHIF